MLSKIETMLTREEIWMRFAEEIGANYWPGDLWSAEKITITMPPWNVTITIINDSSNVTCTCLSANYLSRDGMIFSAFRHFSFEDSGPLRGEPKLIIGQFRFDNRFHVAGTPPNQVKRLFANDAIQKYMLQETHIGLSVENNNGPGAIAELTCNVIGTVKEPKRLLALVELMGETLQYLCVIGSAEETAVGP